jgi:hypothetical protein
MNEIIPYKKNFPAKPKAQDLSPAVLIAKITPFRVQDLPDRTLYEFVRIPEKSKEAAREAIASGNTPQTLLKNDKVRKNCAYIAVMKRCDSFQIGFFPDDELPQVIKNLPLKDLPMAVQNLRDAGF